MDDNNTSRQGISNIPEICAQQGISRVIICPGSRNAPLILSFTRHPELDCLSIIDERSAGYFALGIAQYSGKPVGIVCTSGTAVLNIAPSVAEAYYQNLPLVVFTADRPKEWVDQSDGQTIRQTEIFRNYIKASFELPVDTVHPEDLWYYNRTVSQAIDTAMQFPAGPVHINIPLREPLYTALPDANTHVRLIKTESNLPQLAHADLEPFIKKWDKYKKKMVILGVLNKDNKLNLLVRQLSLREDTVVFAENISNIEGEEVIYALEPLFASLSDEEKSLYKPDLLITIGEGLVSKRIKQYLRAYSPSEHWHIGSSANYTDTFKSLNTLIKANPFYFLKELLRESRDVSQSEYGCLKEKNRRQTQQYEDYAASTEMSDMQVINYVMKSIPDGSVVHLANSMPVRYSQLSPTRNKITYFANRGTSGIDGCISTAMGSAYVSGAPTFIISGDLAFIYDSNSLWNNYLHVNLKIIVINNNGGNIFNLIDTGSEMNRARQYFETPHRVKIKHLAEAYGASYMSCENITTLSENLFELIRSEGTCILEINTDPKVNTKVFKEYYQLIKQALIL